MHALTDQERRCLELMVEGHVDRSASPARSEIRMDEAQALEAAIIQKFGANNRFQAVAKAVLLGIVRRREAIAPLRPRQLSARSSASRRRG